MAKKDQTVRNEQTEAKGKPDDLHKLIIDAVHNAANAQSLDNRFLSLAKSYCDESGTLDTVRFQRDCETQEQWIKSDKAGKNKVDTLPGHWRNTKSTILRAVKPKEQNGTGKSLTEFNTMHELRKELPRKPRTPKGPEARKTVAANLDPRIVAELDGLREKLDALAALSLSLNAKGLDDLQEELAEINSSAAGTIKYFKDNAEAYAKEAEKVQGAQKPEDEVLDVDEPEGGEIVNQALEEKTPARKH